jgi:hypothetical protein
MKTIILILVILNIHFAYGQEQIFSFLAGPGEELNINFEDTAEYKYISIDTNNVWFITNPQKEILFLPPELPELGEKAIISDTNNYYKNNLKSSFQFKLYLESSFFYYIFFRYKYDFEKNKDGGIIETSYNNGETWKNILFDDEIINYKSQVYGYLYNINDTIASYNNQPGFTGLQSEMEHVEFDFQKYGYDDTVLIRFTISTDSVDSQNEGWMFDDFRFFNTIGNGIYNFENSIPSIKVFPNPSSDIINIICYDEEIVQLQVLSLTGDVIFQENNKNVISVKSLKPGMYFIKINNSYFSKIIKE